MRIFLRSKLIKKIDMKIEKEIASFFHLIKRSNEIINEKNKYKIFKVIFECFFNSAKKITRLEKIKKEEKYINMLINRFKKTDARQDLIFLITTTIFILIGTTIIILSIIFGV